MMPPYIIPIILAAIWLNACHKQPIHNAMAGLSSDDIEYNIIRIKTKNTEDLDK